MRRIALTRDVKKALKPALWGNAEKRIFNEIAKGVAVLSISANRQLLIVTRQEGDTLVVVAVAGRDIQSSRAEIIEFARALSCRRIRFHTKNPEHLKKGLAGLNIRHERTIKRVFGRDEHIYFYEV